MPQRRCALKRLRADKKRRSRNLVIEHELKKTIRSFLALVSQKKVDEAKSSLNKVLSKIDKAVAKGILHKRNAARKKAALTLKVNTLTK
jgi:small subunit ribosomal protein S20